MGILREAAPMEKGVRETLLSEVKTTEFDLLVGYLYW